MPSLEFLAQIGAQQKTFESQAKEIESLKKQLADNIADSNHQRHNFVMSEIKVKSQAKELEGLREWKEDASEMLDNIKYWDTVPDDYLERIDKLLPQDTTQPDTKQKD